MTATGDEMWCLTLTKLVRIQTPTQPHAMPQVHTLLGRCRLFWGMPPSPVCTQQQAPLRLQVSGLCSHLCRHCCPALHADDLCRRLQPGQNCLRKQKRPVISMMLLLYVYAAIILAAHVPRVQGMCGTVSACATEQVDQ